MIQEDLHPLRQQVARYLAETNWDEWENNAVVIKESAAHKFLAQTVQRMKKKGFSIEDICSVTGLKREEIESL